MPELLATNVFPDRPGNAPGGDQFYAMVEHLPLAEREALAEGELTSGNAPECARRFVAVPVRDRNTGRSGEIFVATDYLSVGEDGDCLRIPLTPITAQRVADTLGCILPTTKMVDDTWRAAVRQTPIAMTPPGPAMMGMPRFREHHRLIEGARVGSLGDLVAGHKKDVVITRRLAERPPKVAIYGFHHPYGGVIQPFACPHEDTYCDYSHGIRLVWGLMRVGDDERPVADVLADPMLAGMLSYEGSIAAPRYAIRPFA